jgi:hypothetical protein
MAMLRKAITFGLIGLTAGLFSVSALAEPGGNGVGGLAKFKIWSVNIIAYENCPQTDNANRISVLADFEDYYDTDTYTELTLVDVDKRNKIFVIPGPDFDVIDSNACDDGDGDDGAILQLAVDSGQTVYYDLWIRLVGKPESGVSTQICAIEKSSGYLICETPTTMRVRDAGRPTFQNATNDLLKFKGASLFDSNYEDYFWGWNTQGRPHAQLWFVEGASN